MAGSISPDTATRTTTGCALHLAHDITSRAARATRTAAAIPAASTRSRPTLPQRLQEGRCALGRPVYLPVMTHLTHQTRSRKTRSAPPSAGGRGGGAERSGEQADRGAGQGGGGHA